MWILLVGKPIMKYFAFNPKFLKPYCNKKKESSNKKKYEEWIFRKKEFWIKQMES